MTDPARGAESGPDVWAEPGADPGADLGDAVTALEREFASMFARVRTRVRERAAKVHPELSPAGFHVLQTLVNSGPQHARSLAAQLCWDKSMVSRLIKQLLEWSLIERWPDPADGRAYYLVATADAAARMQAVSSEYRHKLRRTLGGWQVAEVQQLTEFLHRLNADAGD